MFREPRRKDRTITNKEALAILEKGEYGVLATADAEGQPYAVPLSYVLHDGTLYFHCGVRGHKLDNIETNPRVSFCVVGPTQPVAHATGFSSNYESCIIFGTARKIVDTAEKHAVLFALTRKYFPDEDERITDAITRQGAATALFAVSLDHVTAKARR